jgi:hypothetical protein
VSNVSLTPVPSEQAGATCAHCGAALVADQRYCLACGQPCSPVRLAFLDVLQGEQNRAGVGPSTIELTPAGYVPVGDPSSPNAWLRRYSGLLGLLSVLLMCLIVGLLVGHWVTHSKAPVGKQVVEVKGLVATPGAAAAPAASATPATTSTTPTTATPAPSKSNAKAEAEEAKAAAKETKAEKAPPPKPVKVTPTKLKKLTQTTGKQHAEEVNALGATPIETG